jgi:hypothetical protein
MIASSRDVSILQDDFNHDDYMQYLDDYDRQYSRDISVSLEGAGGSLEDNTPVWRYRKTRGIKLLKPLTLFATCPLSASRIYRRFR